jgi:hypothetical protein
MGQMVMLYVMTLDAQRTSLTRRFQTLQTQDSLQETGPGGGQAYNVCSA